MDKKYWIAGGVLLAAVLAASLSIRATSGQEVLPAPPTVVPVIENISASPDSLWPANHKMKTVTITAEVTDDATDGTAPTWAITGVASNEPVEGPGKKHSPDWVLSGTPGDNTVQLRAERLGNGTGRIYTITITATNAVGSATGTVTVAVPHDKGEKKGKNK